MSDLAPVYQITVHLDGDDDTTIAEENVRRDLEYTLKELRNDRQIRDYEIVRTA